MITRRVRGRAHGGSWSRARLVGLLILLPITTVGCAPDADDGAVRPLRVVRLEIPGCGLAPEIATGFGVDGGWIITNAHPLRGDGPITTAEGTPLRPLAMDWRRDIAVLAAPGARADLPVFRDPAAGESVSVVRWRNGAPAAIDGRVRSVAPIRFHDVVADSVVQRHGAVVEAPIVGGDSGSPLVGADGRVLGAVFASARNDAGVSFAVAASEISGLVAETQAGGGPPMDRRPC